MPPQSPTVISEHFEERLNKLETFKEVAIVQQAQLASSQNSMLDKIDFMFKELAEKFKELKDAVVNLSEKVPAISNAVSDCNNRVTLLEAKVLEVASLKDKVSTLERELITIRENNVGSERWKAVARTAIGTIFSAVIGGSIMWVITHYNSLPKP